MTQKGLNNYLETKRTAFPRFYFLSNEDLLEILSQIRDPRAVQPHLKKCFENINELEFDSSTNDISSMVSLEKERIRFLKPISPAGLVENWLSDVEKAMKTSIESIISQALEAYTDATREKWLLDWPGQIVLVVSQLLWTSNAIKAIEDSGVSNNFQGLKSFYTLLSDQINQTVKMLRGNLSRLHRFSLEALIVNDVHARDIINSLIDAEVAEVSDFEWISKARPRS